MLMYYDPISGEEFPYIEGFSPNYAEPYDAYGPTDPPSVTEDGLAEDEEGPRYGSYFLRTRAPQFLD